MSVKFGLLAILSEGDCYGYQLRGEFDRRTGARSSLNVGQTYTTLDRLERDGLVERGDVNSEGHVFYRITQAGRLAVTDWLDAAEASARASRDDLVTKIAIAVTLPGIDAAAVIATERLALLDRLAALTPVPSDDQIAAGIVDSAARFKAEGELAWLDHVERTILTGPVRADFPLAQDIPRRGRPSAQPAATV